MRAPEPTKWLTLIGGPAVLASLMGYAYLHVATSRAGLWLGMNWQEDKLRILECGVTGLAYIGTTIILVALPILLAAVTQDAGRLVVSLSTTSLWGQLTAQEGTSRNLQSWTTLIFGAPILTALVALRPFGMSIDMSLLISAIVAAVVISLTMFRLRLAGWSTSWRTAGWLIGAVIFSVLAGINIFFAGLQIWSRTFRELGWVVVPAQVGWAVVVTAISAWAFSPADRKEMRKRVAFIVVVLLFASLSTSNSLQIVRTTLAIAARGGEQGVLLPRSPGSPLELPANACADPTCTRSVPIQVVGYVGDRISFWYRRPLGNGMTAIEWDDVPANDVRLQHVRPGLTPETSWILF